jgi:hypothetical protein
VFTLGLFPWHDVMRNSVWRVQPLTRGQPNLDLLRAYFAGPKPPFPPTGLPVVTRGYSVDVAEGKSRRMCSGAVVPVCGHLAIRLCWSSAVY